MEDLLPSSSSTLSLVPDLPQEELNEYEEAAKWVDENSYINLREWVFRLYFERLEGRQETCSVYGQYTDAYISLADTCILLMEELADEIQRRIRKNTELDLFAKRKELNTFIQLTQILQERIDLVQGLFEPIISNLCYGDYVDYSLAEALNSFQHKRKAVDLADAANKQNLIKCESPIEKDFVESIYREFVIGRASIDKLKKQCNIPDEKEHFWLLEQMEVQCQADERIHPELKYRIDVAFPRFKLAVELDGHEFHSTKEARSRDTKRDRAFIRHGWQVIRFTGSDIFRDVDSCVEECIEVLYSRAVQLNITG